MSPLVVSHDPSWKKKFAEESVRIQRALGQNAVAIHHVGSTSIPDILAKPIIDILVEVLRIDRIDDHIARMTELTYESLGEYGITGRRYFRRAGPDGRRAFHAHVYEQGSEQILRHIAFRDYLLAHPHKAREYSALKAHVLGCGIVSPTEYQASKAPFVEASERDAIEWYINRT